MRDKQGKIGTTQENDGKLSSAVEPCKLQKFAPGRTQSQLLKPDADGNEHRKSLKLYSAQKIVEQLPEN